MNDTTNPTATPTAPAGDTAADTAPVSAGPVEPTAEQNPPGIFHVTGEIIIEMVVPATTAREAVSQFLLQEPEAAPTHVGSRAIIGTCENTGRPILDGDKYTEDGEGVMILDEAVDGNGETDKIFEDEESEDEG